MNQCGTFNEQQEQELEILISQTIFLNYYRAASSIDWHYQISMHKSAFNATFGKLSQRCEYKCLGTFLVADI